MTRGIRISDITHAAAAIAAAVCLSLSGCTGCHRESAPPAETPGATQVIPPERTAAHVARHDPDALHRYAQGFAHGEEYTAADIVDMLALCEGTLQHLGSEIDNLERNDDAADTYNVLCEISQSSWFIDVASVIRFAHTLELPPELKTLADAVYNNAARIRTQINNLEQTQLNGAHLITFPIDH